jgi:hypothetical protein
VKKPPFVLLALFGLAILAAPRTAAAQSPLIAHVPFAFVVDGRTMPAGDYTLSRDLNNTESLLQIVSRDGRNEAFMVYENTGIPSSSSAPSFQFKKIANQYVLWRVSLPGDSIYEVPTATKAGDLRYAKAAGEKGHKGND